MKKTVYVFITLLMMPFLAFAQSKLKSPSEFLGYELGSQFTQHFQILNYYHYVAENSGLVKLQEFGKTYENRPLIIAVVSSKDNLLNIDSIRTNNLRLTGLVSGKISSAKKAIVWLSYNVHGNESVSTEASMQTLYDLVNPENQKTKKWIENTVVIIDPCLNPDGRERYVQWYNQHNSSTLVANPDAWEHNEPWPGGRTNHYFFDMNRDWAWQTQRESQARTTLYRKWMPQVHVDFHEMGLNEPYYFAPAAEPLHEDITNWQRDFQKIVGKNNASYFDRNGWLYFSREIYDLLYPSYGDTWPTYSGAIGMTYEQGGSGRAGLGIETEEGDTLTLKDRISHHYTTGLSTIEMTSQYAEKLVSEFQKYFEDSKSNPAGSYKSYVIKVEQNQDKIDHLADILTSQGISFGVAGKKSSSKGFSYQTGKTETVSIDANDLVISANQPKSVMLNLLFEPKTFLADSVTYDITAWALPYVYDLNAFALTEKMTPSGDYKKTAAGKSGQENENPYAVLFEWKSMDDIKFLSALLKNKIQVRYSEEPFEIDGKQFGRGTLIVTKKGNDRSGSNWAKTVYRLASDFNRNAIPVSSGFVCKGRDFGSSTVRLIKSPRIGVFAGNDVSPYNLGEIWHFFEQQIEYPVSIINASQFGRLDLSKYDVLIFPAGYFGGMLSDKNTIKLTEWISSGGKIIALSDAVADFAEKKDFGLESQPPDSILKAEKNKRLLDRLSIYGNRERDAIAKGIPGSILKIKLDNTHPLAFGYPDHYFTLKLDTLSYTYLKNGWNVGVLKKDSYVSGFTGSKVKSKTKDALIFGTQPIGRGEAIYMIDNPLFRGFWFNGKLLFGNAVFFW